MRIEFTILLVVTFISIFVMAYSAVQDGATTVETTVETIVGMPKPEEMSPEATEKPRKQLPHSGGLAVRSVLLPAAALLVGSSILAYAVLRRK